MDITGELILKARITKNIKDKEYKKLLDALPVGEEYGISKELMLSLIHISEPTRPY